MKIREMSRQECFQMLASGEPARLACALENQPYVVPVYLFPHGSSLYGVTTPGMKVEWMRANPLVCVEVDRVTSPDQWVSVIAFGRYEELIEPREGEEGGEGPAEAWGFLKERASFWEPAASASAARPGRAGAAAYNPVYYRFRIDRVTGHEATR